MVVQYGPQPWGAKINVLANWQSLGSKPHFYKLHWAFMSAKVIYDVALGCLPITTGILALVPRAFGAG
jgi:hypothetical protein